VIFESQLEMFLQKILDHTQQKFQENKHELDLLGSKLQYEISRKIEGQRNFLDKAETALRTMIPGRLMTERDRISHISHTIKLLDPKRVLERGYSITMINGKLVKSTSETSMGDEIETRLSDGTIKSIVK
jgi:exodeoxyribonuclease VII large subunit